MITAFAAIEPPGKGDSSHRNHGGYSGESPIRSVAGLRSGEREEFGDAVVVVEQVAQHEGWNRKQDERDPHHRGRFFGMDGGLGARPAGKGEKPHSGGIKGG